jgi:hypothetical protein
LYIATSEYFGKTNKRVPSIFYAIVDPSARLCDPHIDRWGMVASEDKYALAFPAIAARREGVVLAFTLGSDDTITLDGETSPAYAGERNSHTDRVGHSEEFQTRSSHSIIQSQTGSWAHLPPHTTSSSSFFGLL